MDSYPEFDRSEDSAKQRSGDSARDDLADELQLPGELSELERCLAQLQPEWSASATSDMMYQVALQEGIERGRIEGRKDARREAKRGLWLGSLGSAVLGTAASLVVLLSLGFERPGQADSTMAESGRRDRVDTDDSDTNSGLASDSELQDAIDESDPINRGSQADNDRVVPVERTEGRRRLATLLSPYSLDRPGSRVGSTQWLLDRGAVLEVEAHYVEQPRKEATDERPDYLNRRNRMLSDPDVL